MEPKCREDPEEYSRGTSPRELARRLPLLNPEGSPTEAIKAVELSRPMPGTEHRDEQAGKLLESSSSWRSTSLMSASSCRISAAAQRRTGWRAWGIDSWERASA